MDPFNYHRRPTTIVHIGTTPLGGNHPIRIQSMADVSTLDTETAVHQAIRMIKAGAEYIRFTAQGEQEAQNLQNIRTSLTQKGYPTPLIADIHFNPQAANIAALYAEKVRINPGNYADKARKLKTTTTTATRCTTETRHTDETQKIRHRFIPFLKLCREHNTAIRIGVNHGSLSDRIMNRYGDTPEGMVASCMEYLRICVEEQFNNVVLSIKASNTTVMIRTVRLLVRTLEAEQMHYPLHLGVTEAGDGEDGRIKSALGIGTLLADGIGDTIRISLSEAPEAEIPVARKLADYISSRAGHPPINAVISTQHDPTRPTIRRKSRAVNGIGGNNPPIVISDRTNHPATHPITPATLQPDWIYTTPEHLTEKPSPSPSSAKYIIDATDWNPQINNAYPCFSAHRKDLISASSARIKFIDLTYPELDDDLLHLLQTDPSTVILLNSHHKNVTGEMRAFMHRLQTTSCDAPVILRRSYADTDAETLQIKASVDFGSLLTDGFGDGIMLSNPTSACNPETLDGYMYGILQAARVRISKTEYISCPGCGRTLFNLQQTLSRIKAATSQLIGLKIGIMGCIVNGPGEMADADYGYVGAGRGRISLYKGNECIMKNIPEEEAVPKLIEYIRQDRNP
jgi:(E)-4-hydroxy-3-methylbut-2-enyl-diphosphate synthase